MFTWILIILAVAFVFGVIKIEQIKEFYKKHEPKVKEVLNNAKTIVEEKANEIKMKAEAAKSTTTSNEAPKPAAPIANNQSSDNQAN